MACRDMVKRKAIEQDLGKAILGVQGFYSFSSEPAVLKARVKILFGERMSYLVFDYLS